MSASIFVLDHAELYDLPGTAVPLVVGVSGPKSVELASDKADGIMATEADRDLVDGFRRAKPDGSAYAEVTTAWAPTADEALRIAHERFPLFRTRLGGE